jgi:hypothetical protein
MGSAFRERATLAGYMDVRGRMDMHLLLSLQKRHKSRVIAVITHSSIARAM